MIKTLFKLIAKVRINLYVQKLCKLIILLIIKSTIKPLIKFIMKPLFKLAIKLLIKLFIKLHVFPLHSYEYHAHYDTIALAFLG